MEVYRFRILAPLFMVAYAFILLVTRRWCCGIESREVETLFGHRLLVSLCHEIRYQTSTSYCRGAVKGNMESMFSPKRRP